MGRGRSCSVGRACSARAGRTRQPSRPYVTGAQPPLGKHLPRRIFPRPPTAPAPAPGAWLPHPPLARLVGTVPDTTIVRWVSCRVLTRGSLLPDPQTLTTLSTETSHHLSAFPCPCLVSVGLSLLAHFPFAFPLAHFKACCTGRALGVRRPPLVSVGVPPPTAPPPSLLPLLALVPVPAGRPSSAAPGYVCRPPWVLLRSACCCLAVAFDLEDL